MRRNQQRIRGAISRLCAVALVAAFVGAAAGGTLISSGTAGAATPSGTYHCTFTTASTPSNTVTTPNSRTPSVGNP